MRTGILALVVLVAVVHLACAGASGSEVAAVTQVATRVPPQSVRGFTAAGCTTSQGTYANQVLFGTLAQIDRIASAGNVEETVPQTTLVMDQLQRLPLPACAQQAVALLETYRRALIDYQVHVRFNPVLSTDERDYTRHQLQLAIIALAQPAP